MGIRMTQDMGLHKSADEFLQEFCKRTEVVECPTCHHKTGGSFVSRIWEDASHLGMFEDGPALREYTLKNECKVKEVVQASPWSSGPMIYLCLEDEHGNKMFPWPEEEIE
jgi:hypothetical protein